MTYMSALPSAEEMLQKADAVMYTVKRGGKKDVRHEARGSSSQVDKYVLEIADFQPSHHGEAEFRYQYCMCRGRAQDGPGQVSNRENKQEMSI